MWTLVSSHSIAFISLSDVYITVQNLLTSLSRMIEGTLPVVPRVVTDIHLWSKEGATLEMPHCI